MSQISDQHKTVLDNLAAASKRAGRSIADLVAVSKVQPDARIAQMLKTGQRRRD